MTPPMFALYLSCLLLGKMAHVTALKQSPSLRLSSVSVGEDVTLECFYRNHVAVMFYWYKQALGQKPQLVSKFYRHDKNARLHGEFKNNPRFKVETTAGKNHLNISHVQMSDSATYHCISGYSYLFEFIESITVSVQGSGMNIPASVQQSASETIQPGGSVTLNCTVHTGTCDGEHSVYWFKSSGESHPGLIYTRGGRDDQCERKPSTQTHSCVYNLPMKSLNLSHAGTYYCAVASCGRILFGNGTKLDFEDEADFVVLVYFLIGALAFTTILVVWLAYTAYTKYETNRRQCTDSAASALSAEGCQDADSLHYAGVREIRADRSVRQRDDTWSECVYTSVKQ